MAAYGTPGGGEVPQDSNDELTELSPDQLQRLNKEQLTALLAAFARTGAQTHPSKNTERPLWELENFASSPGEAEAPLRFLIWRDQVEQWLRDHEHLPTAIQLSRIRGALKGAALTEFNRLQNGLVSREALNSPLGLLQALQWSFVPADTQEKATNRLHRWVYNKHDILASARSFLDDLRLAGVRSDGAIGYWADVFLAGFPLDLQERLTRSGQASVAEYYSRLHALVAEQTYRRERCRLPAGEASITLEQIAGESRHIRTTGGAMKNLSKGNGAMTAVQQTRESPSGRPWCRYHQNYGHSTGVCRELEERAKNRGVKPTQILAEIEAKQGGGNDRNFRPQPGAK